MGLINKVIFTYFRRDIMLIKYGDAENINVIQPLDLTDEETKKKLENLKGELSKEQAVKVSQEQE